MVEGRKSKKKGGKQDGEKENKQKIKVHNAHEDRRREGWRGEKTIKIKQ